MPRQLTDLVIDEVSMVDRGAGRGVDVMLLKRDEPYWKREFSDSERQSAAESGAALPDGSFPIKTKQDLRNAIQAIGRAKNRARAMAHIKTRARALGASDMLPDEWQKRDAMIDKALKACVASVLKDGGDVVAGLTELVKQFAAYDDGPAPDAEESPMAITKIAELQKALAIEIAKMSAEHKAFHAKLDGESKEAFAAMEPAERDEYMQKHPHKEAHDKDAHDKEAEAERKRKEADAHKDAEAHKRACESLAKSTGLSVAACDAIIKAAKAQRKIRGDADHGHGHGDNQAEAAEDDHQTSEHEGLGDMNDGDSAADKRFGGELKKRDDQIANLTKALSVLTGDKEKAEFGKRAVAMGLTESQGEILRKAHKGDPESLKKLEDIIKGLNEQVSTGNLFKEFGANSAADGGGTAVDQLNVKAAEIMAKSDGKLTQQQAFVKAMEQNPELAQLEKRERAAAINGGH